MATYDAWIMVSDDTKELLSLGEAAEALPAVDIFYGIMTLGKKKLLAVRANRGYLERVWKKTEIIWDAEIVPLIVKLTGRRDVRKVIEEFTERFPNETDAGIFRRSGKMGLQRRMAAEELRGKS